jgi:hypothetical protein
VNTLMVVVMGLASALMQSLFSFGRFLAIRTMFGINRLFSIKGEISLTRMSIRVASLAVLAVLSLPIFEASAQQNVPPAPAPEASAPTPAAAPVFPPPDPANFTAAAELGI